MNEIYIFVAVFYLGAAFGAWLNRKPPVIKDAKITANLTVTSDVASQLTTAIVMQWLSDRGLEIVVKEK